jgi:predicted small lipoprotein YifL
MKPCWAQYLLWLVIAVLGTASILTACGQKGDLYRPDAVQKPSAS